MERSAQKGKIMALQGKSKRAIQNGVDNLEPFKVGNVHGEWFERWENVPQGRLPNPMYECMRGELRGRRVYVIFSYETPIAWWGHDPHDAHKHEWIIPDVKYSVSTSNHQGVVIVATTNEGFYANAKW